jgi:hypothetical protein
MTITTRGFAVPALLGLQLAAYIDQSAAQFGLGLWSFTEDHATTYGLNAGSIRLRLVLDRLDGRRPADWGVV